MKGDINYSLVSPSYSIVANVSFVTALKSPNAKPFLFLPDTFPVLLVLQAKVIRHLASLAISYCHQF